MVKLSVSLRNALRALRLTIDNTTIYLHLTEYHPPKSTYICIMDIQTILVFLLFAVALVYVGRLVFKSLQVKKDGCGGNCKCGVDFSDIKPVKK